MFSKLMTKLLETTCKKIIIADRETKAPYMVRYILIKNKYFSIYFHRFMQSDSDVPHCHPWNFFTFVITKGYIELLYKHNIDSGLLEKSIIPRGPLSLRYRKAESTHVVQVDKIRTLEEINEAPLTVCLLLKRRKQWGFYNIHNDGFKYTDWRSYLGITKDDPRYYGSE